MATEDNIVERLNKLIEVVTAGQAENNRVTKELRDTLLQQSISSSISGRPTFKFDTASRKEKEKELRDSLNLDRVTNNKNEQEYLLREAVNREQGKRKEQLDAAVAQADFLEKHPKLGRFLEANEMTGAGVTAWDQFMSGDKDFIPAVQSFVRGAIQNSSTARGLAGAYAAYQGIGRGYNRIDNYYRGPIGNTRRYGNEAGYLSPTGIGAVGDIFASDKLAFPQIALRNMLGLGGGIFGASQAATEGAHSNWRAFVRSLNPFDALSYDQAKQINSAVLQHGYKGNIGISMEEASSDIVNRMGIDSGQAVSFFDLAVRRFNMNVKEAKDQLETFGELSKASMKGLNQYIQEVQQTVSFASGQGLRSGSDALNLGKIMSSVPQMSSQSVQSFYTNPTMQGLIMSQMAGMPGISNNATSLGQLSTGNIFGVNQNPYAAITAGSDTLTQLVKSLTQGMPNNQASRDQAYMIINKMTGLPVDRVRYMYENRNQLKSQAQSAQYMSKIETDFSKYNKQHFSENMGSQWRSLQDSISQTSQQRRLSGITDTNLKSYSNSKDMLSNFDWNTFLGSDYSDSLKKKVEQAVLTGQSSTGDKLADSYVSLFNKSMSSQKGYTDLMTYYAKDADKLAQMNAGDWGNYVQSRSPDQKRKLESSLQKMLKSAAGTDPEFQNSVHNQRLVNDVMTGKTSLKDFQSNIQQSVDRAKARAEGRQILISLSNDAAKLIKISGPDSATKPGSSLDNSGFSNRNETWIGLKEMAIQARGGG